MKEKIIARLNEIAHENNKNENGFIQTVKVCDWVKYDKNRTYFSIVETRCGSKHYKKQEYGYFDNTENKYYGDLHALDFTFAGAKMLTVFEV